MEIEVGASKWQKGWVVQKYGGTSIGKFPHEISGIIYNEIKRNRVAVVCSARSSGVKAEGTTTKEANPYIPLKAEILTCIQIA